MDQSLATLEIPTAEDMGALGQRISGLLSDSLDDGMEEAPLLLAVKGELGAGKSTLVRGILRGLGVAGPVPSPTYTLVEPYEARGRLLLHVDLYRLSEASEAEFLGLRDSDPPASLIAVEWPERYPELLELADLVVDIEYTVSGRRVRLSIGTARGGRALARILPLS